MSIDHLKEKSRRDKTVLSGYRRRRQRQRHQSRGSGEDRATERSIIHAVGLLAEEDRHDAARAKRELASLTEATPGGEAHPKGAC